MIRLGELRIGSKARIVKVGAAEGATDLVARLMEMGFLESSSVEVLHEAPFGGDPIAVRVRGAVIALRRAEANQILVEKP